MLHFFFKAIKQNQFKKLSAVNAATFFVSFVMLRQICLLMTKNRQKYFFFGDDV